MPVGDNFTARQVENLGNEAPVFKRLGLKEDFTLGDWMKYIQNLSPSSATTALKAAYNAGTYTVPVTQKWKATKAQTCNPSATINTYGTAVSLALDAGFSDFVGRPESDVVLTNVGSETITVQWTFTYSDSSTATATQTTTSSATLTLSAANIIALVTNGKRVTGISVACKSSIGSSTATGAADIVATEMGTSTSSTTTSPAA